MDKLPHNETATATILTHPAFDRPAVVNVLRPGRRGGNVVSMQGGARVRRAIRRIEDAQESAAVAQCARAWGVNARQAQERIFAYMHGWRAGGGCMNFHEAALYLAEREVRHV